MLSFIKKLFNPFKMSDNKNCDSCNSCDSCNYCNYCDSCNSCNSCYSCNYCYYCYSCNYCYYCYSCDYSKGLRMSEYMIFCLGEGQSRSKGEGYQKNYGVFNKDVTKEEYREIRDSLPTGFKLTQWIKKENMTYEEKQNNSSYKTAGGYLKVLDYETAWRKFWNEMSQEDRDKILNIPQFDAHIFKGITGIDVSEDGDKVEITLEEIAELKGIPVDRLRIKD